MDASNASEKDGVMLAFLPIYTDWCKIDLPHMTLVYAGVKGDLQAGDFNTLAKDAASLATLTRPFSLAVKGVEIFGDLNEQVKVLKLQPTTELLAARRFVEKWNKSQHPFNPHCTIGPYSSVIDVIPRQLAFDRLMVAWGEESITFWLNSKLDSRY